MSFPVVCAANGAAWEGRFFAELKRSPEPAVQVVRRCVDVVDLLSAAGIGQAVAAVVDAGLRQLDADVVDRLAAAGMVVIGVLGTDGDQDSDRLHSVGIEYLVPWDAGGDVIGSVVLLALNDRDAVAEDRAFADPSLATGSVDGTASDLLGFADNGERAARAQPGEVIVVWGPTGAPGRTTVAVALADELSRLGRTTMLVDADVYGGVVAASLGVLDESPGLAAACRQAQSRRLDAASLLALAWQLNPKLRVLTGITRADRWPELRTTAIAAVLAVCRGTSEFTIVDVGFSLESDEELSFDTLAPRRNGATLAALDDADRVLVVGSADPIGVQRLIRALSELREAQISAPASVVLNRVRRSVVPGDPAVELDAALQRFAGVRSSALLPLDQSSVDAAHAAGKTLAEISPNSSLRRAVLELARTYAGVVAPVRGRRRQRR